jgi:Flp pilus assembly protein TadD
VPTEAVSIAAPALAAAAYGKALAVYREGRRNEALGLIDQALVAAPRDVQLRFLKGVVLTELNSTDAAMEMFRALVQDFPELPEPYNNLAVLQAGTGGLDAARETLEGATRALPSYALAHENLGDIYLRMAIRAWETAEYLKPAEASRLRARLSLARELSLRLGAPAPNEAAPKAEPPQPDRPRQPARQP